MREYLRRSLPLALRGARRLGSSARSGRLVRLATAGLQEQGDIDSAMTGSLRVQRTGEVYQWSSDDILGEVDPHAGR